MTDIGDKVYTAFNRLPSGLQLAIALAVIPVGIFISYYLSIFLASPFTRPSEAVEYDMQQCAKVRGHWDSNRGPNGWLAFPDGGCMDLSLEECLGAGGHQGDNRACYFYSP